jgi:hypothetical protein
MNFIIRERERKKYLLYTKSDMIKKRVSVEKVFFHNWFDRFDHVFNV